jgi:hypothetical protein
MVGNTTRLARPSSGLTDLSESLRRRFSICVPLSDDPGRPRASSSHATRRACKLGTVSAERVVVREPTDVMLIRVADDLPEMQRAWASFDAAVGLRGRKFYGAFDPVTQTYSVCTVRRPGDEPARFGAEHGTLPGGRYACVRLMGEPPAIYGEIGPTAERLAQRADADPTRPTLEYYRRHDVIDVLVPVV